MSTRVSALCFASLADLNSYNKPFPIPQALRQSFFRLVVEKYPTTLKSVPIAPFQPSLLVQNGANGMRFDEQPTSQGSDKDRSGAKKRREP
jgi:hypothetical protein